MDAVQITDSVVITIVSSYLFCCSAAEMDVASANLRKEKGMPFGIPKLEKLEYEILIQDLCLHSYIELIPSFVSYLF